MLTGKFSKRVMCALALAAALGATAARAQDVARIAAVNSDRILRESAPAKAAQTKLEAEFAKRDKDLQDMAARLKSMSDALDRNGPTMSATIARRSSATSRSSTPISSASSASSARI